MAIEFQLRKGIWQGWASYFVSNTSMHAMAPGGRRCGSREQRVKVGKSHLPPNNIFVISVPITLRSVGIEGGLGSRLWGWGDRYSSSRKHSKIPLNINLHLLPSHFKLPLARDHHIGKGVTILAGIIDPHVWEKVELCTV